MTDLMITMIVLTIGITVITILGSKVVQEVKKYNKLKAEIESVERWREESREIIRKTKIAEGRA